MDAQNPAAKRRPREKRSGGSRRRSSIFRRHFLGRRREIWSGVGLGRGGRCSNITRQRRNARYRQRQHQSSRGSTASNSMDIVRYSTGRVPNTGTNPRPAGAGHGAIEDRARPSSNAVRGFVPDFRPPDTWDGGPAEPRRGTRPNCAPDLAFGTMTRNGLPGCRASQYPSSPCSAIR